MTRIESKRRRIIGACIAAAIFFLLAAAYLAVILFAGLLDGAPKALLLIGIVPAAIAVCVIAVCIQRIKEINKGEEDDAVDNY